MTPRDWIDAGTAHEAALACARGCYQRAVLSGEESLSGATLRGKAKKWSSRYAASRASLLARIEASDVEVAETVSRTGRRVLVAGSAACALARWAERARGWHPEWPGAEGGRESRARRVGRLAIVAERASLRGDERLARAIAATAIRALRRLDREHEAWLRPYSALVRLAA